MKYFFSVFAVLIFVGAGCLSRQTTSNIPESPSIPTTQVEANADTPSVIINPSITIETVDVPSTPDTSSYTMSEVTIANTADKCWTVINNNVYNLTAFIAKHPGGEQNILKLCGIDGTSYFENKHGGQEKQEQTLAGFKIGVLVK